MSERVDKTVQTSANQRAIRSFRVGDRLYTRSGRPFVMGILNLTPDSFSDGGRFSNPMQAVEGALQMQDDGADFIDIGGESSRPGATSVSENEELKRVLPVIEKLAPKLSIPMSIDTVKAAVARRAVEAGAQIINDISALRADPEMLPTVLDSGATLILMHMQGDPRTMQANPSYHDLIGEIRAFLAERIARARRAGVAADRVIIDPGIGFGKRLGDNYEILRRLCEFNDLGPVLVGPSRKSFIGQILNLPPAQRRFGTAAAVAVAVMNGADMIRVHDVKEMVQVAEISYQCLTRSETGA